MNYTISGVIHAIFDKVESKGFTSRKFRIIESENPKFPQTIEFQLSGEKWDLIDPYHKGQPVTVHFNLRGREWTPPQGGESKCFNTLEAWKLEKVVTSTTGTPKEQSKTETPEGDDDLPF